MKETGEVLTSDISSLSSFNCFTRQCPEDQAAYAIQCFPTSKTIILAFLDGNQILLESLPISNTSFKAEKKCVCVCLGWGAVVQGRTGNNLKLGRQHFLYYFF